MDESISNGISPDDRRFGLSADVIKYILITVMVIDHIAWAFVARGSAAWEIMHFFGRLTGPGMAYFLVQGYMHTRDLKKYAVRLFIFGLISWPCFVYYKYGTPFPITISDTPISVMQRIYSFPLASGSYLLVYTHFGVVYTLFLSLMMLRLYDDQKLGELAKVCGFALLFLLSVFGDWPIYDLLFTLIFYVFRDRKKLMWFLYCVAALLSFESGGYTLYGIYQTGLFLVPVLLSCYNGKRSRKNVFNKWFFYVFYPLHLLVLGLIRWRG
ncbi:MAG: hypothetical protein J5842_07010 [Lachnospiraceae bacterium]|nr:hypothetical protein [Lachnospiraceae bacterium]